MHGLSNLWVTKLNTLLRLILKKQFQMVLLLLDHCNGKELTAFTPMVNTVKFTLVMDISMTKMLHSIQLIHLLSKMIHRSMNMVRSPFKTRQSLLKTQSMLVM
jgi:hypothetical protein